MYLVAFIIKLNIQRCTKVLGNIYLILSSRHESTTSIRKELSLTPLTLMELKIFNQVNFDSMLGLHKDLTHLYRLKHQLQNNIKFIVFNKTSLVLHFDVDTNYKTKVYIGFDGSLKIRINIIYNTICYG